MIRMLSSSYDISDRKYIEPIIKCLAQWFRQAAKCPPAASFCFQTRPPWRMPLTYTAEQAEINPCLPVCRSIFLLSLQFHYQCLISLQLDLSGNFLPRIQIRRLPAKFDLRRFLIVIQHEKIPVLALHPHCDLTVLRHMDHIPVGRDDIQFFQEDTGAFFVKCRPVIIDFTVTHRIADKRTASRIVIGSINRFLPARAHRLQKIREHACHKFRIAPLYRHFSRIGRNEGVFRNIRAGQIRQQSGQFLHHASAAHVLVAAAASDHQRTACFHISPQHRFSLPGHDRRMRVEQHLIFF